MTSFTHDTAPTQYAEAAGTHFAYRRFGGPGRPPLVFYQHFMGNLDDHDPALSDAFAGLSMGGLVAREVALAPGEEERFQMPATGLSFTTRSARKGTGYSW